MSTNPVPSAIKLHKQSATLELVYADGQQFVLSAEYLRVFSPSAEVKGHGPGQEVLQFGKRHVKITDLKAVGNYAVQPTFSDGHDSGIFSWDYLHYLGSHFEQLWQEYQQQLSAAGKSREPDVQVVKFL